MNLEMCLENIERIGKDVEKHSPSNLSKTLFCWKGVVDNFPLSGIKVCTDVMGNLRSAFPYRSKRLLKI